MYLAHKGAKPVTKTYSGPDAAIKEGKKHFYNAQHASGLLTVHANLKMKAR